jgi:hypothetical protein
LHPFRGCDSRSIWDWPSKDQVVIANDRVVNFSFADFRESTERYPSFTEAENHVKSALETMRGEIQNGEGGLPRRLLDESAQPASYFHLCGHAEMDPIQLSRVAKVDGGWQLTLVGPNAASAILSLDDNYETVGVKLSRRCRLPPLRG